MTASASLRPTRRGALAGTLLAVTISGCDAIAPSEPTPTKPQSDDVVATPADPDEVLVADARTALAQASLLVDSTVRKRPGLTDELTGFAGLHVRHLRALESRRPRGRTPVRGDAAAVRRRVRVAETRLQASLATAAVAAESGQLAALLASMSAAIAQELAAGAAG